MIYRTDYHTHTKYSDGHGTPEEYIPFALKENISELGFSDHLTLTDQQQDWSIRPDQLDRYVEEILALKDQTNGLKIRLGLEVDYLPGKEEEIRKYIDTYPLDFVIGSIHYIGDKPVDLGPSFYMNKDLELIWAQYFKLVKDASETGLFDIIGHLDLVRIFKFLPDSDIEHLYKDIAGAIMKNDLSIELNTNGKNKPLNDFYPDPRYLHIFREAGVPVCVNSDSHFPSQVGQHFDDAYAHILRSGYREMITFDNRVKTIRKIAD